MVWRSCGSCVGSGSRCPCLAGLVGLDGLVGLGGLRSLRCLAGFGCLRCLVVFAGLELGGQVGWGGSGVVGGGGCGRKVS